MKRKAFSRVMAVLLCAAMLVAFSGVAFAASITPASGYAVAVAAVNVRSGPGADYSIIGWLQQGAYATATGIVNNGWLRISYNGNTGYVNAAYMNIGSVQATQTVPVNPVVPSNPVPVIPSTTSTLGTSYVNVSRLNLRTGPSTRYSIASVLTYGQVVNRLAVTGNWTQVEVGNVRGYVYSRYLSYSQTGGTVPVTPVTPSYSTDYYYTTSQLNIRSGPGEYYSIIGYVNAGSIVRRVGTYGTWTKIRVSNGTNYDAYVSTAYLVAYTYSDAASRVVYPTCYTFGYSGGYGNYNYNWSRTCSSAYPYYCGACGIYNSTYLCNRCGKCCTRVSCGSNCNSSCNNNCTSSSCIYCNCN